MPIKGLELAAVIRQQSLLALKVAQSWWKKVLNPDPRFVIPIWLVVVTTACIARAYAGLFGLLVYSHDAFAVLGPAWRIINGQKPHINFSSNLGPLPYLQTAFGLTLSSGSPEGMVYGQAIFGFVAAVWAFGLLRTRINILFGAFLSVYILLLAIAPFNIGEIFAWISPGMAYNRSGYALIAIFLIEVFTPADKNSRSNFLGGLSSGTILGLLLFTKITYFLGAILIFLVFLKNLNYSKSRLFGIAVAFILITAAFSAYLNFDFAAIWNDYRLTAAAKHIGPTKVLSAFLELFSLEGGTYLIFVFLSVITFYRNGMVLIARRTALMGVCVLLAGSFLLFGNFQERGLPLNPALAVLIAANLTRDFRFRGFYDQGIRFSLISWAVLLALGPIASNVSGITYAVVERSAGMTPAMKSPGLLEFRTREDVYAALVDDGLALANQYRRPDDTITSLDYSDFFSYGLRIKPPLGGATCLHYKSTFSDSSHLSPEHLFGSADLVMVPKHYSEDGSQASIPRIYGPFLERHFHLEGESRQWRVYRRKIV